MGGYLSGVPGYRKTFVDVTNFRQLETRKVSEKKKYQQNERETNF